MSFNLRFSIMFRSLLLWRLFLSVIAIGAIAGRWVFGDSDSLIEPAVSSPVASPSGDMVAFALTNHNETELSIISLTDKSTVHTGVQVSPGLNSLCWSPDQKKIAFASGIGSSGRRFLSLGTIDLSTKKLSEISLPKIWKPEFSPKGTYLGYVRGDSLVVHDLKTRESNLVHSGVSSYFWCWGSNEEELFYVRDKYNVCKYNLKSSIEDVMFSAPPDLQAFPEHLVSSPDGSCLGYYFDGWFHTVDLRSLEKTRHFKCDHYFLEFDWNADGICYVNSIDNERRSNAEVMVYDPVSKKSSSVVTGAFSFPRWLGESRLLIRRGNTELWAYRVDDGSGIKLFSVSD